MSQTIVAEIRGSVSSPAIDRARSSGTPAFSSVDSSWVKNRMSRAAAALERRQLELEARFSAPAPRIPASGPGGCSSRATRLSVSAVSVPVRSLPSARHRPEVETRCRHLELLRHAHHFFRRWSRPRRTFIQPSSRRLRMPWRRAASVIAPRVRVAHDQLRAARRSAPSFRRCPRARCSRC